MHRNKRGISPCIQCHDNGVSKSTDSTHENRVGLKLVPRYVAFHAAVILLASRIPATRAHRHPHAAFAPEKNTLGVSNNLISDSSKSSCSEHVYITNSRAKNKPLNSQVDVLQNSFSPLYASPDADDYQRKKLSFRNSIHSSRRGRSWSSSLSSSLDPNSSNTATLIRPSNSTLPSIPPMQERPLSKSSAVSESQDGSKQMSIQRQMFSFFKPVAENNTKLKERNNTPEDVKVQLTTAINNIWKLKKKDPSFKRKNLKPKRRNGKNGSSPKKGKIETKQPPKKLTIRNLWKRRHARSIEEGIRRERTSSTQELTKLLDERSNSDLLQLGGDSVNGGSGKRKNRRYAARTIAGLISALAEESTGLEVEVDARNDTPIWGKQIDAVKIQFQRLGFKQMRMGGLDKVLMDVGDDLSPATKEAMADKLQSENLQDRQFLQSGMKQSSPKSVDEVFDKIDIDNSGSLDENELARALSIASGLPTLSEANCDESERSATALSKLASRLVGLYDTNGDGVVDREEYRKLVEDMTAVRNAQRTKQKERAEKRQNRLERKGGFHPLRWARNLNKSWNKESEIEVNEIVAINGDDETSFVDEGHLITNSTTRQQTIGESKDIDFGNAEDLSDDPTIMNTISKGEGSIVFSGLKLDLRRLVFGAVPLVKRITPGGPLILEPFTTTVTASFNRQDILESALLDDGLRRLVARALRRRVRSIRDLLDGAVFYGRTWNMASKQAPVVEVPRLTNIEFDNKDRLIITGRARTRVSPDQPFVENSFKLRTKLGTRENGQYIRLEDPELAIVLECPRAWERNIVSACKNLELPVPKKPEPIYQFIPLVSPIKKTEQDGFNLGEDNQIKSIYIKDNALRFELSFVLRPGRFLGNHYLAFTIPNRTFIMTMDRIREGMRNARRNKLELERAEKEKELNKQKEASERYDRAVAQALSQSNDAARSAQDIDLSYKKELYDDDLRFIDSDYDSSSSHEENEIVPERPGFFGRFREGYLEAAREETERERNERLTYAISEFFGNIDAEEPEGGLPAESEMVKRDNFGVS